MDLFLLHWGHELWLYPSPALRATLSRRERELTFNVY